MMDRLERTHEIVMMISFLGQLFPKMTADFDGDPARWKIRINSTQLFTGDDELVHAYLSGVYDLANSILYYGYEIRAQQGGAQ